MAIQAGGSVSAPLLLLVLLLSPVQPEEDSSIMDNDHSRKLLGSSVVTSVSVIMEHGNGSKTVIKDGNGAKPQIVGTPGSFLSPDRYEFYSLDDSGDLVKRLMSLEEIQSLIAASRPELAAPSIPIYYHRPLVEPDIVDEGVQNVLANVQSVLREELAKEREPPKPQPLPIDDSWSLLLPGLFGSDLDFKQEPMLSKPIRPTPSYPDDRPTNFPTSQRPTYPQVTQGTTFDVLPPVTHPHTTPKPIASTTKPVKYSAHYTTVKIPPLIEKLPDTTVAPLPPSRQPPKIPYSTNRPSTIIHYLPIESISPSTQKPHYQKPVTTNFDNNNVKTTTQPPKKIMPVKTYTKTTVKPLQDYTYNKTYQRITVKPVSNYRPVNQTTKPVKYTSKPVATTKATPKPTSKSTSKPTVKPIALNTVSTSYSTIKPSSKPFIRSTQKPDVRPFTEYQIMETVATRKPSTSTSANNIVKKPRPTKTPGAQASGIKNQGSKPSFAQKIQTTVKPPLVPATDKLPPPKYKPTNINMKYNMTSNKVDTVTRTTKRPTIAPLKVSSQTYSTKPVKATPSTPTLLSTKPTASKSSPKPSVTTPSKTTTTKLPSTISSASNFETVELVPVTQDDDVMASSAAALIQDLLRTETNPNHFTKPTTFSSMPATLMTLSSFPSSEYVSTQFTTIRTSRPTAPTKISTTSVKPPVTRPTSKVTTTSNKISNFDRHTTIAFNKYNTTKKPVTSIPKPVSTYKPTSKIPQTQTVTKPPRTTIKPTKPIVSENISAIKSEALTQKLPPKNESVSSTKKPTKISVIPVNDIKKFSSLNQLISARPDIVSNKTTSKSPSTTTPKITSTSVETTKYTETIPITSTVESTSSYSETDSIPSSEYINSDMIYKVISTLQSNPNKITYPTTMRDVITSTMKTVPTEFTTNSVTSGSTTVTTHSELVTDVTTEDLNLLLKSSDTDGTTEQTDNIAGSTLDSELIRNFTMTTIPEYVTSAALKKKPIASSSSKLKEKLETTSLSNKKETTIVTEEEITSTVVYSELLTTDNSTPSNEESTPIITTNVVDSTTDQDSSTNLFEDEAVKKGISAVANILLDDPNIMRRLKKPNRNEDLISTTVASTYDVLSTTTEGQETTTDLNLLRLALGPDNMDLLDYSTTSEQPITITTDAILSTTEEIKMERIKTEVAQREPTTTTQRITTKLPSTTKAPVKTQTKVKPNLVPTKESKLDDSMISEVNKLMATQKPTLQQPIKINSSSQDKPHKFTPSKPNRIPTEKPNRIPSEKPIRVSSFKPNSNKTSSTNVNTTNAVKVDLKNHLNDKFFKKPGINSYQPNVQPPAAIDLHPAPQESLGLEASTAFLQEDIKKFSDLLNEIGFRLWSSISGKGGISSRSFVMSPFAATSMLAMVFLGARGPTSGQMNDVLRLDDMVTFNPHQVLKNVTESVINSKNLGVATASFVRELYSDKFKGKILDFYKERVHQYYDGHVEEVNFNAIGDIVRRRTNLLVKRQTLGKLPEYLRGSSLNMRPPLAAFTANIFQSDCEAASTEGRDGEMYFVVRPSTRQRRLVPVPAVVWRSSFLAGYEPSLDATSVCLGPDSVVSTILVLPGQQGQVAPGDGLARLEQRLIETSFRRGAWSKLLRSLLPRPGLELQLPRFSHRSVLNITQALRHMGLKDLFTSRADLRGLNGVSNDLHLSDMVQVNTFSTCGEEKIGARHHTETYPSSAIRIGRTHAHKGGMRRPRMANMEGVGSAEIRRQRQAKITEDWLPLRKKRSLDDEPKLEEIGFQTNQNLDEDVRIALSASKEVKSSLFDDILPEEPFLTNLREGKQYRLTDPPRLRFDRPFLYMIRHNPTGIILHMGRFNPRLLP